MRPIAVASGLLIGVAGALVLLRRPTAPESHRVVGCHWRWCTDETLARGWATFRATMNAGDDRLARGYPDDPIEPELVRTVIAAARLGKHRDPWLSHVLSWLELEADAPYAALMIPYVYSLGFEEADVRQRALALWVSLRGDETIDRMVATVESGVIKVSWLGSVCMTEADAEEENRFDGERVVLKEFAEVGRCWCLENTTDVRFLTGANVEKIVKNLSTTP